jgi:hypothetical protein
LVLAFSAALGAGTRPAGFVIGIKGPEGEFLPAPGIAAVEWATAIANPHLTRIG